MATPSSSPRIPFDVVEHIIEHVSYFQDESKIFTLKSFALVSRDCLSSAQRGLFRTVTFSSPTYEEQLAKYNKFKATILLRPQFVLYVREFSLREDALWDGNTDSLIWEPSFPGVLDMLQRVSKFKWTRRYNEDTLRWAGLSVKFQNSLTRIFTSPHITNICLTGIVGLPPFIAIYMASIPCVEISYVQFALNDSGTILEDTNVIDDDRGIESFTIGMIHTIQAKSFIDAILSKDRRIKKLQIAAPVMVLGTLIPRIMHAHKGHLSTIGIPSRIQPDDLSAPLEIKNLPNLEHLRYALDVSHTHLGALTKACNNLRLCCKEGKLKTLTFEIWYNTQWEEMYTQGRLNWEKLDELLVERLFCNLQRVYFVFGKDSVFRILGRKRIEAVEIDNVKQLLESYLPKTREKGLLDCSGLVGEARWLW